MEIKQIKLSPKRGGNGFISSYSINIGSKEARDCGLMGDGRPNVIIKLADPENGQIILRVKRLTLTKPVLEQVMEHAALSEKYSRELLSLPTQPDPDTGIYRSVDDALLALAQAHDDAYFAYLLTLPLEMLTDIMTLMCMGRDRDVNMALPPLERFLDYWQQLEQFGCFSLGADALASQLMYNQRLCDYLRSGIALLEGML